jgi:hypothetical protein
MKFHTVDTVHLRHIKLSYRPTDATKTTFLSSFIIKIVKVKGYTCRGTILIIKLLKKVVLVCISWSIT